MIAHAACLEADWYEANANQLWAAALHCQVRRHPEHVGQIEGKTLVW